MITISTIYGVRLGFEILDCSEAVEDSSWGILIDLFAIRIIYIKFK